MKHVKLNVSNKMLVYDPASSIGQITVCLESCKWAELD